MYLLRVTLLIFGSAFGAASMLIENDIPFLSIINFMDVGSDMNVTLTHLPLVPHICVNELGQHWFG